MRIIIPPRLLKRTTEAVYLNALRDAVAQIIPLISPNRLLIQTPNGTHDLGKAKGGSTAAPVSAPSEARWS